MPPEEAMEMAVLLGAKIFPVRVVEVLRTRDRIDPVALGVMRQGFMARLARERMSEDRSSGTLRQRPLRRQNGKPLLPQKRLPARTQAGKLKAVPAHRS